MGSLAQLFSSFFAVALLLVPVSGQAQQGQESQPEATAENTARARTLFADGVELAAEGQFEDAAARFRAAYGFRPAPAIAYNLAAALVELDQLLEASELARSVRADDESTEELVELSVELQGRIEERLARLSVTVDGDHEGVSIEVDGRVLSPGELGIPIPMNPGTHEVIASRGEVVVERQEASLEVGGSATVSLSSATWPDAQVIPESEPETEPTGGRFSRPGGSGRSSGWSWWARPSASALPRVAGSRARSTAIRCPPYSRSDRPWSGEPFGGAMKSWREGFVGRVEGTMTGSIPFRGTAGRSAGRYRREITRHSNGSPL